MFAHLTYLIIPIILGLYTGCYVLEPDKQCWRYHFMFLLGFVGMILGMVVNTMVIWKV